MREPRDDPNSFAVAVEPPGPAWRSAPTALRLRYYQRVGLLAAPIKDRELARGLDRHGRPLAPIAAATRAARRLFDYSPMGIADPKAPPLTPCYAESRTRSLLRWKAYADRVVFFWAYDPYTQRPWGEILDYHRKGAPRVLPNGRSTRLPERDVIGLSPASTAEVRRAALRWWAGRDGAIETNDRGLVGPSGVVAPIRPAIGDYSTGPRRLRDGVFTAIDVGGKHIDRLATARAGGRR